MKKHNIFETNPNLKEVHMTSDGESFYNDNDAKLHAKSLKDKTVELVVNPSQLEVITDEDEDFDENVEKIGEGSREENTATKAKADGSVNVLSTETPEVETPEVEAPEVETPEVETPEAEAPEVEAPEVETPEAEAPEVETPEAEAPEVETPEVETPEVEAKKVTPKKSK